MSKVQKLKIAALTGVCVFALAAVAQAQNDGRRPISDASAKPADAPAITVPTFLGEVTFGLDAVTNTSAIYGRYNGMPNAGLGVISGWNLQNRDPWDSGNTKYFNFTGTGVNFGQGKIAPEANISAKVGEQGTWSISASYDAMTYVASDSFTTILDQNGNLSPAYQKALQGANMYFASVPTLPATLFGAFNATTGLATANPITTFGTNNEIVLDVGTRRDKGTIEGVYQIDHWALTTGVSHEHKQGTLEQTMTTGGNNAGMVDFPMPINYDTDLYTAAAAYNTDDLQAKISYRFSSFTDNNGGGYAFQGWNFAAYKTSAPITYTSLPKSGDYSLPPSTQAHTFSGELGYNYDATTRLYATAVYGIQLQNAPFVPATNMGYFSLPVAAPLAAQLSTDPTSLNGWVETFFGNATITSRPIADLDLKASYSIDTRDPHTSSQWIYGDPTDTTALKYRYATPLAWNKQEFALTAGYRIMEDTRMTAGYTYRRAHRTNAVIHDSSDNEGTVNIYSTFAPNLTGSLGYLHASRTTSAPDFSFWLAKIPSDCGSTLLTLGCQQVAFFQAARTQDTVTGRLMGNIDNNTSFSFVGKYNTDEYHNPPAVYQASATKPITTNPSVGVHRDYSISGGPDVNYQIDKNEEVHVYYTFVRNYRAIRGLNNQSDPTGGNYWAVGSTYDVHMGGIGGTWQASDKTKVVADYIVSYAGQEFAQSGTWNLGFAGDPLLTTKSVDNQIKIHADYDYDVHTSFYLGYQFDSVDTSNFSLVGKLPGFVLTGDLPPKYNVSKFTAAMTLTL